MVQRMTNVFMELFNGNSNTDRDAVKKVCVWKMTLDVNDDHFFSNKAKELAIFHQAFPPCPTGHL